MNELVVTETSRQERLLADSLQAESSQCIESLVKERFSYVPPERIHEDTIDMILTEVMTASPFVTKETLCSQEMWKYFGGKERLSYYQFGQVVRVAMSMCAEKVGSDTIFAGRAEHVPSYAVDDDATSTLKNLKTQELEHLHNVLEHFGYWKDRSIPMAILYSDVRKVSKYVSFSTLASQECYQYLGERFRPLTFDSSRDLPLELLDHVKMVADVLTLAGPNEMLRIRGCHSGWRGFLQRKLEMIELYRRFGYTYRRWSDERKKIGEQDYDYLALNMSIFWGIYCDKKENNGKMPSFDRVVTRMVAEGLLDRCLQDCKWAFIMGFDRKYKARHLLCTTEQFDVVKEYVRSVKDLVLS